MRIEYTFSDIGASVVTAFIQEMKGNVSGNSMTVNCVRADSSEGWSSSYGLLVSIFH